MTESKRSKFELALEVVEDDLKEFEILDDLENVEKAKVFKELVKGFAERIRPGMNEREKIFTLVTAVEALIRGLYPEIRQIRELKIGHGQFRMKYQDQDLQEREVRW